MTASSSSLTRDGVVWVCAGLTLAIAPHWLQLAPWIPLLCLLCIAWRLFIAYRRIAPPTALVRLGLTALAVFGTYFQYGTVLGREAGIALLVLMLSLKLLELRNQRDAFLVACLSYFVVATQFLFNQDPLFTLYMLGVVLVITTALMVLQDTRGFVPRTSLLRQSGGLLLQAAPLMGVLFLLFPRLPSPLWGVPELGSAKTGLSDEMAPGSIISLFVDDSPAFRVSFEGPTPELGSLYWRGPVLWHYDGTTWSRKGMPPHRPELAQIDDVVSYRVTLEPHHRHWLFALDVPLGAPEGALRTGDLELLSRRPVTELRAYQVRSARRYVASPELGLLARHAALQLPAGYNPETFALGQRWARQAGNDRAIVQRALNFFQQQPFIYSLSPPPLGRDAMDDFLFQTRNGYCEHYASAFTVLMRAAGVPARVVTGYLGGSFNRLGDYVLVRQSDAHAWSEVWLPDQGWVRVDPTAALPLGRVQVEGFGGAAQRLGQDWPVLFDLYMGWDALQSLWNRWLIAYDHETQKSLIQRLGADAKDWRDIAWLLGFGSLVALGLGLLVMLWRGRERHPDPAVRAWRRFQRKLKRAGLPTSPSEGPRTLARRAARQWPSQSPTIGRITRNFIALHYRPQVKPGALSELKRALQSLSLSRIR